MKLCAVTDEISDDVNEAILAGIEEGIHCFELRTIKRNRFPFYANEDFDVLYKLQKEYNLTYSAASPGIFKINTAVLPWEQSKKNRYEDVFLIANRLGCPICIIFAGKNTNNEFLYKETVENIKEFTLQAAKFGIKICLENSANTFCNSAEEIIALFRDIDEENLHLNWDPGNAAMDNVLDIDRDYEVLRPYIANVHIKDVLFHEDGRAEFVPIGDGIVDYRKILSLLYKGGFDGCITIETHCKNRMQAYRKSAHYLKQTLNEIISKNSG